MLNGGKDISALSDEWRAIVLEVIDLKLRLDFGVTVLDKELSAEMKIGIEAFQIALNKKNSPKK